jgi:hypothetical protein
MSAIDARIGEDDRRLLLDHYAFYRALETGSRVPTTPAQRHFVAVCRGVSAPETDHEWAYARFKRACAAANLDEAVVLAARFVLTPPDPGAEDADGGQVIDVPVRPCAGCGRPISPERLQAIPEAALCVSCQERAESASTDWRVSEVECPRCAARGLRSRMVWRTARDPTIPGYFLGCSRFPDCRYVDRS